jgi:Na+/H+ antiporter NhaD/arsenite permease-like protein
MAFAATAFGLHHLSFGDPAAMAVFLSRDPVHLLAISLGTVFFGAMTYIGNGPNLMVKSIAESAGVPAPNFAVYIQKYSLPILLPLLAVVWAVFFR